jgi:hypothetical protein
MKSKKSFFDRFFHFIAGVVNLHAFIQICNPMIDATNWGFKEWSSLIIAVLVSGFMIIYRWVSDNDDPDDDSPKKKRAKCTVRIGTLNLYMHE